MTLRFALLGTPSLTIAGRPVTVPPARPQAVLTALLLGEGRRVSMERLIEALWEEPPPSALPNIRGYIARLRRLLGCHGDRLSRSADGYALTVGEGEVDLALWRQHLTAADHAARNSAYAEAADEFAAALGLWRGPAADGVPRRGAVGRALDAWDETRRTTIERHAEASLSAGRYAAAVDVLRPFVAEHPLREVAWEHYIRALAAIGDRPGALAAYAAARQALVEQLGIEPGSSLQDLQRTLLGSADVPVKITSAPGGPASLRRHSVARPGKPQPSPAVSAARPRGAGPPDLPPCPDLVGRDDLLATVRAELDQAAAGTVIALHGPAGVGKSVLAVRAALQATEHYARRLHLDLLGSTPGMSPLTAADIVGALLRLLGVQADSGSALEEACTLRAALKGQRSLIILDNVVDAAQVRSALSALGTATAVLTSRAKLSALDVTRHVSVGQLSATASVDLLASHCRPQRVADEPEEARQLAALCGHLPLALRIVGGRLASHPEWTLRSMVDRLAEEKHRLDELAHDDLAVRAGLAVTTVTLADRPGGENALRLLAAWGGCGLSIVGTDVARVLLDAGSRCAYTALDQLSEARLIEPVADGRYGMHDLVRLYAMEFVRESLSSAERQACAERVRRYYLATARRARDLIRPEQGRIADDIAESTPTTRLADASAALAWLTTERVNFLSVARYAAADESPAANLFAPRLVVELYPFLPMSGHYRDWLELSRLAVRCAQRAGSRPDEAAARIQLAGAYSRLDRYDKAVELLHTAVGLAESEDVPTLVAQALEHLAITLTAAGDPAAAAPYYERCAALHRARGDTRRLGITLNNFGDALLALGDTAAALAHLQESLALRQATHDRLGIGITVLTIGQAYAQDGQLEQAARWLDRALAAARGSGNREAEWRALTVRAGVHQAAGQVSHARADLDAALALSANMGNASGLAQVRAKLNALA
jgi:DNA-binding SARP family transcriptional activator/Tfp pilus assembly protein PilF